MKKLSSIIIKHIEDNIIVYFMILIFFVIGISAGAFTSSALSGQQNNQLITYIEKLFQVVNTKTIDSLAVLKQSLKSNFLFSIIMWVLGITIVGIPIALGFTALRGFVIGFSVAFFVKEMSIKGILVSLSLLPQNLIQVPTMLLIAGLSISFSVGMVKNAARAKNPRYSFLNRLGTYTTIVSILIVVLSIGCLVEAYVTPLLIKLISTVF